MRVILKNYIHDLNCINYNINRKVLKTLIILLMLYLSCTPINAETEISATHVKTNIIETSVLNVSTLNAPIGRSATYTIAAYDSALINKLHADFICDGFNDQVEIQDAINSVTNAGKIVFTEGTYIINASIVLKQNITYEGIGYVVFKTNMTAPMITVGTNHYANSCVSVEPILENARTITAASVNGVLAGMYLKISDDTKFANYCNGEMVRVRSVSDNVITLGNPTQDNYSLSPRYRIVNMHKNIIFNNIIFSGPGIETSSTCFSLYGVTNLKFIDCIFENWGTCAIRLIDCTDCVFDKCIFRDNYRAGYGYSINLANACDNIIISNCIFEQLGRHYIATGGTSGTRYSDGTIRSVLVTACIFENSTEEAINTHDPARGVFIIDGCKFMACAKGIETMNVRQLIISNNEFIDCIRPVCTLRSGNTLITGNIFKNFYKCYLLGDTSILNNVFEGKGYISTEVDDQGMNKEGGNIVILQSNVFNCDKNNNRENTQYNPLNVAGVYIENPPVDTCYVISGNTFYGRLNQSFISVHNVTTDLTICNNNVMGTVELYNCNRSTVTGNIISSTSDSIKITTPMNETNILNNVISSTVRGIVLQGSGTINTPVHIKRNYIQAPVALFNTTYTAVTDDEVRE